MIIGAVIYLISLSTIMYIAAQHSHFFCVHNCFYDVDHLLVYYTDQSVKSRLSPPWIIFALWKFIPECWHINWYPPIWPSWDQPN